MRNARFVVLELGFHFAVKTDLQDVQLHLCVDI